LVYIKYEKTPIIKTVKITEFEILNSVDLMCMDRDTKIEKSLPEIIRKYPKIDKNEINSAGRLLPLKYLKAPTSAHSG
jgi:hypothetical protein